MKMGNQGPQEVVSAAYYLNRDRRHATYALHLWLAACYEPAAPW